MFFPEKKQPIKDEQALCWSNTLYECVRKHRTHRMNRKHIAHWSKSFVSLKKKYDPDIIESVLNWYILHYGEDFIPVANNGEAFAAKFDSIHKAMAIDDEQPDQQASMEALHYLNECKFPPEIASKLACIITKTRSEWNKFLDKVESHRCHTREADFLNRILNLYTHNFVSDWILFLCNKYGYLDNYTMPTSTLPFKPTSPWFKQSFWHKWSQEWCGSPIAFDNLLMELLK